MRRIVFILLFIFSAASQAEILSGWERTDASSTKVVDHSVWQTFLSQYLLRDDFGQTYFTYSQVSGNSRLDLKRYLQSLQKIDPLSLNSNEQKAYWINIYNAATVEIVLQAYPVKSIRNIGGSFGGFFPTGPWKNPAVMVNNRKLSLDDIEHGIFRPKFNDYRIHFALNCASMGCPNLSETAYTGVNIESLLVLAETDFMNHQRGVRIQNGKLIVSKLFDWYLHDFVASDDELLSFLANRVEPKLRARIKGYRGSIKYEYDWSLNEVLNN